MYQQSLFGAPQVAQTNDDWYTPQWIFDTLGLQFDLDVAAPPGGIPWIPAHRHFTQEDDGLNQPWHGKVWMNPPFSAMTPWALRFIEHREGVALLTMARSRWFDQLWNTDASIVALPSTIKFMRGNQPQPISFPVLLVAFTDECVEAISRIGKVR